MSWDVRNQMDTKEVYNNYIHVARNNVFFKHNCSPDNNRQYNLHCFNLAVSTSFAPDD